MCPVLAKWWTSAVDRKFYELSEEEQDQLYVKLAIANIDAALKSEDPMDHFKSLQVVKDYLWYLVKPE